MLTPHSLMIKMILQAITVSKKRMKNYYKKLNAIFFFLPESQEMYKDGFRDVNLTLGNLNLTFRVYQRPGHFQRGCFYC